MIKLFKGGEPEILTENGRKWRAEYLTGLQQESLTESKKFRYRHPHIKEALRTETYNKCAYCESKISHIHPGETDHILPISRRPDLCVSWNNLTYVCSECNRGKSDYYSETEPLVNPYTDQPDDHLIYFGPMVLHRDDKGFRTTRKIQLSRAQLFERKQEKIENLNLLVQQWRECAEGETREFLRKEILQYAAADAEFAATIRAFIGSELGWKIGEPL